MSSITLDLNQLKARVRDVAATSRCVKRKVGCVIALHDGSYMEDGVPTQYKIVAEGYNHHPFGRSCEVGVCEVTQKLITDPDVVHAEVHAIDNFLTHYIGPDRAYVPLDYEVFVTYQPCEDCQEYAKSKGFTKFTLVEEKDMGDPQSPQTDHAKMLAERGARYGKFSEHAKIATDLKERMHATPGWARLAPDQKEALDMVQHKVARILNGDPDYKDNWDDIVGYAKLCSDEIL